MNNRGHHGERGYAGDLIKRLKLEYKRTSDISKRVKLLHGLARLLEGRPKGADLSIEALGAALKLSGASEELAWDTWRVPKGFTPQKRIRALLGMLDGGAIIEKPVAPRLLLARMARKQLKDNDLERQQLVLAKEAEGENVGVALAEAETCAAKGGAGELNQALLDLSEFIVDSRVKAALLTEVALRELAEFKDKSRITTLLNKALDLPEADWLVLNDIVALSGDVGEFELQEKALLRMSEAFEDIPLESESDFPSGHEFDGFDRSDIEKAQLWIRISQLREQRLDRHEDALEAMEKAIQYLPDNEFLSGERARLLFVSGRPAEALEAASDKLPGVWRAQLALAAGKPKAETLELLRSDPSKSSFVGEALAEIIGEAGDSPPPDSDDKDELLHWFHANPRHPEAPDVAGKLTSMGLDQPALRLSTWENKDPEGRWPDEIKSVTDEAWPVAVTAVETQSVTGKSEAFVEWSESSSDLNLSGILLGVAAYLSDRPGGDKEVALTHFQGAQALCPDEADYRKQSIRLLHALGKWEELEEQLADTTATTEDLDTYKKAAFERVFILDRALKRASDAQEILADLVERDPDDSGALLIQGEVASRLGDWRTFSETLARLGRRCPDDAQLLNVTEGEVHFYKLGDLETALDCFERAVGGSNPQIARVARRYLLLLHYEFGDSETLLEALDEEARSDAGMFAPERLVAALATRARDIEPVGSEGSLFNLLTGVKGDDCSDLSKSLRQNASESPDPKVGSACLIGAALLDGDFEELVGGEEISDLEDSPETLWHLAESIEAASPRAVEIYERRMENAAAVDDPEWVDWVLEAAHAESVATGPVKALQTVEEALEAKPDHPGLLHARIVYAREAERYRDVVETFERLSEFYVEPGAKADCFASAAHVMLNHIHDAESAREFGQKAFDLSPESEASHNILLSALKALGDDEKVAELLDSKIELHSDQSQLIALYEEQADHRLAMDDEEGAIEALDNLIGIDPDALSARMTKIELLIGNERYAEAAEAMREYVDRSSDPVEVRTTVWRGADIISQHLDDPMSAYNWLAALEESGDRHPATFERMVAVARKAEDWEKCADSLGRLSELQTVSYERVATKREEAALRLEYLFDDEAAAKIIDEILQLAPADVPTFELSLRFREKEDMTAALERAIENIRLHLDEYPVDIEQMENLRRLSEIAEKKDLTSLCEDVLRLLRSEDEEPWPGDVVPGSDLDAEMKRRYFVHPLEKRAPSRVAGMAAEATLKAFKVHRPLPNTSKKTLLSSKENDSVKAWIDGWAHLLGEEQVEVHRVSGLETPAEAIPKNVPAIAISASIKSPLSSRHRFFLSRNLWRAAKGLAAFEEGDTIGPVRWVVAVTVAILGERIELPMPTDSELVKGAKKALPRRLKRSLDEPCKRLLEETRQSLRAWAQAISFSADRFGLLAATRIAEVIPCIIEEIAGQQGLGKFREDPAGTIMKIPRCRELLRFTLSEEYLSARRMVGLTVNKEGGDK